MTAEEKKPEDRKEALKGKLKEMQEILEQPEDVQFGLFLGKAIELGALSAAGGGDNFLQEMQESLSQLQASGKMKINEVVEGLSDRLQRMGSGIVDTMKDFMDDQGGLQENLKKTLLQSRVITYVHEELKKDGSFDDRQIAKVVGFVALAFEPENKADIGQESKGA